MLTDENIKTLIDDLRFGKYDTPNYELTCKVSDDCGYLELTDKKQNLSIRFRVFGGYIHKNDPFGFSKQWVEPVLEIYSNHGSVTTYSISKGFYKSVYAFIAEQVEKDKLLEQTNIKVAFNLQ